MTGSDENAADEKPSHIPESDRPRQNSQQYNAQPKPDFVKPSDNPEMERKAADLTRDNG